MIVRIGLHFIVATALCTVAMAQPARPMVDNPEEMLENRIAQLDSLLDLTDAQEAEIMRINLEAFEAGRKAIEESAGDRRSLGKKLRDLRDDQHAQVLDLLDEDQREAYIELRKKEREQMRERRRAQGRD